MGAATRMRRASTSPSDGRQAMRSRPPGAMRSISARKFPCSRPVRRTATTSMRARASTWLNSSWVSGRGDSTRRSARASAVPSASPTGKTSVRLGGSDSRRETDGYCAGSSSETSVTSMTMNAGGGGTVTPFSAAPPR